MKARIFLSVSVSMWVCVRSSFKDSFSLFYSFALFRINFLEIGLIEKSRTPLTIARMLHIAFSSIRSIQNCVHFTIFTCVWNVFQKCNKIFSLPPLCSIQSKNGASLIFSFNFVISHWNIVKIQFYLHDVYFPRLFIFQHLIHILQVLKLKTASALVRFLIDMRCERSERNWSSEASGKVHVLKTDASYSTVCSAIERKYKLIWFQCGLCIKCMWNEIPPFARRKTLNANRFRY